MGREKGESKKVALLFQFTIHIHIQNYYFSLQFTYTFKMLKQTAEARTLCVYYYYKLIATNTFGETGGVQTVQAWNPMLKP